MGHPSERARMARRMSRQARACANLGSPLYAMLLERVAADVARGGPAWEVLEGHDLPAGSAPALRLMGAVHRIVLEGRAPDLARHYATAPGGSAPADPDEASPAFARVLEADRERLRRLMADPVQTNEVGRSAALLGGFLQVARDTGLPLRVLEIGASAGLNLRFDRFAYEMDGAVLGDPRSRVRFTQFVASGRPPIEAPLRVADRRGCDVRPIDPATEEGRLTLLSYVWPDQTARVELLRAAIEVARRTPAAVDAQSAPGWLEDRLRYRGDGAAVVVFHSIVRQYLAPADAAAIDEVVAAAGSRATPTAPLARLELEPAGDLAELRLTLWPGGGERLLARAGYHGRPVHWLEGGTTT